MGTAGNTSYIQYGDILREYIPAGKSFLDIKYTDLYMYSLYIHVNPVPIDSDISIRLIQARYTIYFTSVVPLEYHSYAY